MKLTLRQRRFIAQTLQVLLIGVEKLLSGGLLGRDCSRIDIEFYRRESLEKCLHDLHIHRISVNVLADRNMILLTQIIAEIASSVFVLHHHFVSALSTVDHPMQQSRTIT